jgi:hypothetical protein
LRLNAHKILVFLGDIFIFFNPVGMKRRDISMESKDNKIVLYSISLD